jgi:hypothetical protein
MKLREEDKITHPRQDTHHLHPARSGSTRRYSGRTPSPTCILDCAAAGLFHQKELARHRVCPIVQPRKIHTG